MKKVFVIVLLCLASVLLVAFNYPFEKTRQATLTLKEFNKRVAREDKLVLVYFNASWCMVCEKVKPVIEEVEAGHSAQLEVLRVDTDRDKEVADYFEVDALPVLMLYKKGTREWINVGVIDKVKLEAKIMPYLR